MADPAGRVCQDCVRVVLDGSPWLKQMIALGFVGCNLDDTRSQCVSPGAARRCVAFNDGSAQPIAPAPIAPPVVKKLPAELF